VNEKKELVTTVKQAEEEKKSMAEQSLSLQALSVAIMGKAMQMLTTESTRATQYQQFSSNRSSRRRY
jgi:hypothetical protein